MRQLKITKQITNRETASLDMYLHDIGRVELITAEEEVVLAQKIKAGDQHALDKLVRANLRFVVSVSKQYQNQGLSLPDLINEGNLGLIKAAQRFDETRGFKFISYAVWWIKQQILYSLNEYARTIRIPSNVIQEAQRQKKEEASNEDGFYLEYREVPLTGIPTTIDLFREINEEGDTLLEIIANPNATSPEDMANSAEDLKHRIKYMMSFLDERESAIIEGYFGLTGTEKNLDDLGEEFGCTKERIRQLKDKAIKKLRNESFSLLKYL